MVEIIDYSFDFISNLNKKFNKNNILKLEESKYFKLFNEIRTNNKFCPKFTKKFNYTNWKKYVSKEEEGKKNEQDILLEKIRSILNKLTIKNIDDLKIKIVKHISQNNILLNKTIEYLFEMAIVQRIYCNVYSKLCVFLNEKYGQKIIKQYLLNRCKKSFGNQFQIKDVDPKTDYDQFCINMKEKQKFIGIFHLVGELYNEYLIDNTIIWNYLRLLFKNFDSDLSEITRSKYVECLKDLIFKIGKKYKKSDFNKFSDVMVKIKIYSKSDKFKHREKFMFIDIIEINDSQWTSKWTKKL